MKGRANPAAICAILESRRESVSVAESLTGGLLAASFVAVPGASAVFRGGIVAYATELKKHLLHVSAALLDARGPVDPDVAQAMAGNVRELCGATWGVATTGVAGPADQDGNPPGECYVAVANRSDSWVQHMRIEGSRAEVRDRAVNGALSLLAAHLV